VIYGADHCQVASTSWHCSTRSAYPLKPEAAANIALILKAVNNHGVLIAALRRLASPEAFVMSRVANEEESARMHFAQATLDALDNADA
jgi:hypothetical protein